MARNPRNQPRPTPSQALRATDAAWDPRWAWLALGVVLAIAAYVRYRWLDVPLDRDEGEYAYIGQQLLLGVPPYESGYAMKMPGIYAAYAAAMACFGQTVRGVHLGFAVVNLASIVLVFQITRRLYSVWVAVAAAGCFALLTLSRGLQGSTAQAEHFVMLPVLLGTWILLVVYGRADTADAGKRRPTAWGLIAAGLCFGTATVIKQHAFPFCFFAAWQVIYEWWRTGQEIAEEQNSERKPTALAAQLCWLSLGGVIPVAVMLLAMYVSGVFDTFWFWTITYAGTYATGIPLSTGWVRLRAAVWEMITIQPVIWALAATGLTALAWDAQARTRWAWVIVFAVCSFLGTCPSLHFWPHAFVFVLPALSILAAIGLSALLRLGGRALKLERDDASPAALLAAAAIVLTASALFEAHYLFRASPDEIARLTYGYSPIPEAREIARYIAEHSREDGPIMVIGSEPQIYFYTRRRAASPHIYMYPLMEVHSFALPMQKQLAEQVEQAQPEWIIFEYVPIAWTRRPNSEAWLLDWVKDYCERHYDAVGLIDIGDDATAYRWEQDLVGHKPEFPDWLAVYRRKPAQTSAKKTAPPAGRPDPK